MTWASAVAAGTGSSGSQEPPSLSPRLPQPTAPGLSTTVDRPPLLPPSSLPKRGERSFTSFRRGANGPKPQLRRHGGGERSPRMRSFAIVHIVRDRSQAGRHRPRPFARTRRNPSSAPTANDVNDVNDLSRTLRTPVCESRRPSPLGGARDDGWNRPPPATKLPGEWREARPADGMEPGVRPHGRVPRKTSRDCVAELSFCPHCPRAATSPPGPMPKASSQLRWPVGSGRRALPACLRPLPAASEGLSACRPAAIGRAR